MDRYGKPVFNQGLVVLQKVFAQGHGGQPSQFQGLFLVMRLKIWTGPFLAEIIGNWVGWKLEAPRHKPSTRRNVLGPVGKVVQRQQSQGKVPGMAGREGKRTVSIRGSGYMPHSLHCNCVLVALGVSSRASFAQLYRKHLCLFFLSRLFVTHFIVLTLLF